MSSAYYTTPDGYIFRAVDGVFIPPTGGQADYVAYLAWVAAGNTAPPYAQLPGVPSYPYVGNISGYVAQATAGNTALALSLKFNEIISVKDFGAIGDGVTDDTAAFVAARNAWIAAIRANPAPDSDGNHLGTLRILVPPGSYLITSAQAFLDSAFTTRTYGLSWEGTAAGMCQILFQPSSPGYLVYNNDAAITVRFKNLTFDGNSSTNCSFMYSTSAGGAQDYGFDNCLWSGLWNYGLYLAGTGSNSEMYWNNCTIEGTYAGAFFYSYGSNQFLNYWFDQCKIDSVTGAFVNMVKGGHVKVNECDFSGFYQGQVVTLFQLQDNSNYNGRCSFVMHGCRFEIGANTTVLNSAWGGGIINIDACDFSSQDYQSWSQTCIPFTFNWGTAPGGPQILFKNSYLMGLHNYTVAGAAWMDKKAVSYENCDTGSFADIYAMFTESTNSFTTYPPIILRNCRGNQTNQFLDNTLTDQKANIWAANTNYSLNQIVCAGSDSAGVFGDWWIYKCTAITTGISGTQVPFGPGVITDGGVTWTAIGGNWCYDFITEGSALFASTTQKMSNAKRTATLTHISGGLGARANATTKGYAKIVLPPNALITNVTVYYPAGASNQSGTATFKVFVDGPAGITTTLLTFTNNAPASGFTQTWSGIYEMGSTIQTRTLVLEAGLDVTTNVGYPAICLVDYLCGE